MVKQTLKHLFELQEKTQNKIDFSKTFEYEKYDELPITHDLYYFKKLFDRHSRVALSQIYFTERVQKIVEKIENLAPKSLMIRDFQARNILVNDKDEDFFFIDYQAAMEGPALYDVVSFSLPS